MGLAKVDMSKLFSGGDVGRAKSKQTPAPQQTEINAPMKI